MSPQALRELDLRIGCRRCLWSPSDVEWRSMGRGFISASQADHGLWTSDNCAVINRGPVGGRYRFAGLSYRARGSAPLQSQRSRLALGELHVEQLISEPRTSRHALAIWWVWSERIMFCMA